MKAQDKVRLEAFRNIKKVILEAKTKPGAGDGIDDAECLKIIQKLAKQSTESAAIYKEQGRMDLYEEENGQLQVLNALKEIIASVGATSPKDMGKVMGVATKQLSGKADGKAISEKVKSLLS